jgi:hypothetical protein
MGMIASIFFSIREGYDQPGCFENTRNFPSEEIPLGYRLRSPLLIGEIASSLRSSQRPLSLSHGFLQHPGWSLSMP